MGKAEEVQEKVKADMEAMATMMEAMMSRKKIMEAYAVAVVATSTVAKVNPMPPSDLNQMNHPTLDMMGKDLGSTDDPMIEKPVEFTPISGSYADLLPYLLDNSMVAITPAKVHQPPFLREYDSNATCACHGEAPGHSIEHCRALKCKVQGLTDAGRLKFEENRM
ncbi:hypothetical protein HKD37_14G040118 [Glycine soja]